MVSIGSTINIHQLLNVNKEMLLRLQNYTFEVLIRSSYSDITKTHGISGVRSQTRSCSEEMTTFSQLLYTEKITIFFKLLARRSDKCNLLEMFWKASRQRLIIFLSQTRAILDPPPPPPILVLWLSSLPILGLRLKTASHFTRLSV